METVFLHLLNNSINAGWLVLAVLLLRFFLKKAPKWINVTLWGLVALRLFLPFSIESVFSLIPSAQTVPPTIMYDEAPEIESGIPSVNEVLNPIITETFAPDPTASANPLQIWGTVTSAVWLVGLILMVGYMLFGYFRLRLRLRTATKYQENIYESEQASSPFILGIFRPRIYLPYNLDEQTRAHVIAHEQAHLKRRDHLLKPLAFLLLAVYWFQPLLWLAYILLCRDIEYACDEKVIKNESEEARRAYSMALLSCSVHRRPITACPLAFGEVGVKQRIKNVMNYKKPAFWLILCAIAVIIMIAVCFLTDPVSNEPFSVEDLPRYFEAIELLPGIKASQPSYISCFYIDKEMNLYEKHKMSAWGSQVELGDTIEWELVGTLQKAESSEEGIETWTTTGAVLHGHLMHYAFYFHENGEVYLGYDVRENPPAQYRLKAVNKMTPQLNAVSSKSFLEDIEVSYCGLEIFYNEKESDLFGNIRLYLWFDNQSDYAIFHRGQELYVDENGAYRVSDSGGIRLEKKTAFGWKEVDSCNTRDWKNHSHKGWEYFILDDENLELGVYRLTVYVDLALKSSDFSSEETIEYAEKNIACGEIIFELVNPGESFHGIEISKVKNTD